MLKSLRLYKGTTGYITTTHYSVNAVGHYYTTECYGATCCYSLSVFATVCYSQNRSLLMAANNSQRALSMASRTSVPSGPTSNPEDLGMFNNEDEACHHIQGSQGQQPYLPSITLEELLSTKKLKTLELHKDLDLKLWPRLEDFDADPLQKAILLQLMEEYEVLICTTNAFPNNGLKTKWVITVWANAHAHVDASEKFELTDRAARLVGPFI